VEGGWVLTNIHFSQLFAKLFFLITMGRWVDLETSYHRGDI
jgi:hypothetical protein